MRNSIAGIVGGIVLALAAGGSPAQEPRVYKEGPVTALSYIKIKPGRFDDYMAWLAGPYRQLMEANKKAGLINGYAIYQVQARNATEPDLVLSVVYPNMAALDRSEEADAVASKLMGSNAAQNKAFADRGAMREVLGGELMRELVLK
jgi:L-rhamnose mutarotase